MRCRDSEIPPTGELKEPRDVTRREPMEVRFYIVSENDDIDITDSVPFNRTPLRIAKHITGLEIGIDT